MADINKNDNLNQGLPNQTGLDEGTRAAMQRALDGGDGGIKVGSFRDLQLGHSAEPLESRPVNENQDEDNLVTPPEHDAAMGIETQATEEAGITVSTGGEDLNDLTVEELKDRLADEGKPVSGTKDELIARLNE